MQHYSYMMEFAQEEKSKGKQQGKDLFGEYLRSRGVIMSWLFGQIKQNRRVVLVLDLPCISLGAPGQTGK